MRITKIIKSKNPYENNTNNENLRNQLENNENHKNLRNPYKNT